jgi:hypothetical protein
METQNMANETNPGRMHEHETKLKTLMENVIRQNPDGSEAQHEQAIKAAMDNNPEMKSTMQHYVMHSLYAPVRDQIKRSA